MRKIFFSLIILLFATPLLFSQVETFTPTKVVKATYFDETPPLKNMKAVLPGERDRSWKDGLVESNYIGEEIPLPPEDLRSDFVDPVLQDRMGNMRTRGPVLNFEGVSNVNGVYPPDTEGDVSDDHYFQMINLSFAIWDKEGNLLYGPVDNSTLWDGFIGPWTGTNDGDPIVLWDHMAERWMASQFAVNTSNGTYWQLIAISQTSDPMGSYYRYAFEFEKFNDYPKLGVWPDGYYATFRMFGTTIHGGVAAFERDKMLAGDPSASMVYFDLLPSTLEILPVDLDGPVPPAGAPANFVSLILNSEKLKIYELDVDWTEPDNSSFILKQLLDVEPFSHNLSGIPQPGTTQTLDEMTDRLMYRLQYRNFGSHEVMLTNHTVNVSGHAGIRWYELRRDTDDWYVYQQGTYSPDDENRWMGSIAMNGNGDIALGFAVSSAATYPSIRYVGREADATLGEMNLGEMQVAAGTTSQTFANRYGDYSMMAVDPSDDSTFWFTQEYIKGDWKTRIVSFDFGPNPPPEVDAGDDATLCQLPPVYQTEGTASYQSSVLWTSSGNGNFIPNATGLIVSYLFGSEDIVAGEAILTLTAYGYETGQEVSDDVVITIQRSALADAGQDTVICTNNDLMLYGTVENASSHEWSTSGDGSFDDVYQLDALYTPGSEDIENGSVTLTLTAYDLAPCENSDSDNMTITLDPCTGMDELARELNFMVIPNPSEGTFTVKLDTDNEILVQVTDISGKIIFSERSSPPAGGYEKLFDLTNLAEGIYLVNVKVENTILSEKVIIQ